MALAVTGAALNSNGQQVQAPAATVPPGAYHLNAALVRDKAANGQRFALCMPRAYVVSAPAADHWTDNVIVSGDNAIVTVMDLAVAETHVCTG